MVTSSGIRKGLGKMENKNTPAAPLRFTQMPENGDLSLFRNLPASWSKFYWPVGDVQIRRKMASGACRQIIPAINPIASPVAAMIPISHGAKFAAQGKRQHHTWGRGWAAVNRPAWR